MSEISESSIPFPHRLGNLYYMLWQEDRSSAAEKHVGSVQRLYMSPYVSSSPRAAYVNYKDLDLGVNEDLRTSYSKTKVWGGNIFQG
ncbi:hypothetical protein GIB67_011091 [Kingdonia uniflora]|uniref:Uncharacterized protein n=1 Tax=Kingdonia uniflora TaxID=39325 RepID=A0A7J7LKQ5_9MAGN|nr:hypothetical protein GIB67_011091 [Kingdonia uniflora]